MYICTCPGTVTCPGMSHVYHVGRLSRWPVAVENLCPGTFHSRTLETSPWTSRWVWREGGQAPPISLWPLATCIWNPKRYGSENVGYVQIDNVEQISKQWTHATYRVLWEMRGPQELSPPQSLNLNSNDQFKWFISLAILMWKLKRSTTLDSPMLNPDFVFQP